MEAKTFEVQGVKLTMGELLVGQFKELTALIEDIDLGVDDKSKLSGLIDTLIVTKLEAFMAIVFYGQDMTKINWNKVSFERLDEILESFLALNPRLRKRLTWLLTILGSSALAGVLPGEPAK
jgi:hypothetical protein